MTVPLALVSRFGSAFVRSGAPSTLLAAANAATDEAAAEWPFNAAEDAAAACAEAAVAATFADIRFRLLLIGGMVSATWFRLFFALDAVGLVSFAADLWLFSLVLDGFGKIGTVDEFAIDFCGTFHGHSASGGAVDTISC